jgi:hypothetical protein
MIFKVTAKKKLGISNTLKGFITALSIHKNTKIECTDDYELGNFDTILEDKFIYHPTKKQVEPFNTWRFLILKDEEALQQNIPDKFFKNKVELDNDKYKYLFTPNVSIDGNFNKKLIHPEVYHRIMCTIQMITFKPIIYKEVNKFNIDYNTTLGISVRTWTASHEKNVNRKYSFKSYKNAITNAFNKRIKTVILSIDNDSEKLETQYINFIQPFCDNIIIYREHNVNHLQYTIIKLLLLSKCGIFIGNRISTFTELVYWFNGCNQQIITTD